MKAAKKQKSDKKSRLFFALYLVGFLGACIIGLFGNSFFAYDVFQSVWANVLYLCFLSLLYVTAFVSECFDSRKPKHIILNAFYFLGSLMMALLLFLSGGVFLLLTELYSAVMVGLIALNYVLEARKRQKPKHSFDSDVKPIVSAVSLILFSMVSMLSVEFVDESYIAWSLIPTAVIAVAICAAAAILLKNNLRLIESKINRILSVAGIALLIFIVAFFYSFTAVGTINCVFDGEPAPVKAAVLEKKVQSGARTITQFKIKISLNETESWISVPSSAYYNLKIGDSVTINRYQGALGFAYWKYADETNEESNGK